MSDNGSGKNVIFSIEGNIGAGKTTFLEMLESELNTDVIATYRENNGSYSPPHPSLTVPTRSSRHITFIPEPIDRWRNIDGHNLLDAFYQDPKKNAFIFQVTAVTTRMMMLDEYFRRPEKGVYILERSNASDMIFATNCHTSGMMTDREFAVYKHTWGALARDNMKNLAGVIYLSASPETCFKRANCRGRSEERDIVPDYFTSLHELHEQQFASEPGRVTDTDTPVLVIDAESDFRPNTEGSRKCVEQVMNFIRALST